MKFKNENQNTLKAHLAKFELPSTLVDKIILHADDNWIEQLLIKLESAMTHREALSSTLELFLLKSFSKTPTYLAKKEILEKFPITKRKFEELVRARLVSYLEFSQKNRVYNIDDIYDHLENYKVDSIVYRVDPIILQTVLNKLA